MPRPLPPVAHVLASPRSRRGVRPSITAALVIALSQGVASLAIAQTLSAATNAPSASSPAATVSVHPYASHVAEAARRFGIPDAWIWSVMRVESAGDPTATSHAGAMGLMQVMPATYRELRSRYGFGPNPYEPRDNILAGAAYLREMHDRYGPTGMLAAYNAGPGRWEDYVARGRSLPAETVAYMARLGSAIGSSTVPSPTIVTQVDQFAWRQAALFVTLVERTPTADPNAASPQAESVAVEAEDELAITLTSDSSVARTAAMDALFAVRRPR